MTGGGGEAGPASQPFARYLQHMPVRSARIAFSRSVRIGSSYAGAMTVFAPVKWVPPPRSGFAGRFEANHRLADVEVWPVPAEGPEDVALDAAGNLYTGLVDGSILRFGPGGGAPDLLFNTGGRPLGIEIDGDGRLIICDAERGLLRWSDSEVEVLADSYEGERFVFTNNASVGSDGSVFFTVTSRRFGLGDYKLDLMEHSGTGRLYRYHPDGRLELLLDGLHFANGVAVAGDDSYLVFAETGMYRMSKLWLQGDRAGQTDVLIDDLPGFPDNLTRDGEVFWVGIVSPRDKVLDALGPRPWAARLAARLPERLQPAPSRYGAVFGIDGAGEVVHNLQDPNGVYATVTAAAVHDGRLYLGSLHEWGVAHIAL